MLDKGGKSYTIEDIARELGVSKTTVSRALSGKGRIGKDTVERVRIFAEQHGYRPNLLAKGLAQSKTYNLGLVIPREPGDMDVPFFKDCMYGICEEASKHDYDIVVSIIKEDEYQQFQRMVRNHKVDGIILSRSTVRSEAVDFLKENGMPLVVIGPTDDLDVVCVDNPNREASCELTGFLLMKGIQRLALMGGDSRHYVTESRKAGFMDAHQERGICVNSALMFMEIKDYRNASWAVEQILRAGADGIVCMDDFICNLVLGCLREKGVEIPSMLKLASLYDSRQMEKNVPAVTSIHFDTKELGRKACIKMLEMLDEDVEEEQCALSYQVILRESTK